MNGALATTIPAGGYGVFSSGPGLSSGGDAVKIYTPDGTLVDQLTYTAGQAGVDETVNTAGTYNALASCPNGGDTVLEVPTASFGASNATACAERDPAADRRQRPGGSLRHRGRRHCPRHRARRRRHLAGRRSRRPPSTPSAPG